MVSGLYLHLPFCLSKCPYCDFFSIPKRPDEELYLKALEVEINLKAEYLTRNLTGSKREILTFYAGGGSPSLFSPSFFERFFMILERYFPFKPLELTLEANPEGFTYERARAYREIGFNRLSLGIQTFQPKGLFFLGRRHSKKDALSAIEAGLKGGFKNISLDFIYGWKGQGSSTLKKDLDLALAFEITHLSFYELTIYPETPFYKLYGRKPAFLREKKLIDLKKLIKDTLSTAGFMQYELSNFTKPSFECRHNLLYWEVQPYLGIGAGAVSRIGNLRFKNTEDLKTYYKSLLEERALPQEILETLDFKELAKEYLFMGLRLTKGIEFSKLEELNYKINEDALIYLYKRDLIDREPERFRLTDKGSLLHNQVVKFLWNNLERLR